MDTKYKAVLEGIVKKRNKDFKNLKLLGVKPEEKGKAEWRPKTGTPMTDRQLAHKNKRGVKKSMMAENLYNTLFEGLVKAANKAKKNAVVDRDPKTKNNLTDSPNAKAEVARDMAGASRKSGKKNLAKIWLKASKGERMKSKAMEQIETSLILGVAKLIAEGVDDLDTTKDSISNAGGSADTYAAIKAKKDAKLAKAARNTGSRSDTLGKMGGMYDKKGKPASKGGRTSGTEKFAKGDKSKPMPLNPRRSSKPRPGSNPSNVRGKTVNTSRGDADSIAKKTSASDAIAHKFYSALSKNKKS